MEKLLLKACRMESNDEELATITEHYSPDIHMANLRMQLQTLSTNLNPDDNVSQHYVVNLSSIYGIVQDGLITLL